MKRAIRAAAYALSFLLLAAVFLHTGFARSLVRFFLAKNARLLWGVELSAGALDYRLWRGEVVFQNLVVAAGPGLGLTLRVERLEARAESLSRLALRLMRPHLRLQRFEARSSAPAIVLPAPIGSVDVSEGRVEIRDGNGKPWLDLEEIELTLRQTPSGHEGTLLSRRGRFVAPAGELPLSGFAGRFAAGGGRLDVFETRGRSGSSLARVRGAISGLSPLEATLAFDIDLEADLARRWDRRIRAAGRVRGSGSFHARGAERGVEVFLRSDALSWERLGPVSAQAKLELANDRIALPWLTVKGYAGRAQASGQFQLGARGKQELQLRWAEVDVDALLRDTTGSPLPLASRLGGEADLRLTDWNLARAEGAARLLLSPGAGPGGRLDGRLSLKASEGAVSFQSENMTFHDGTLAVSGILHPERGWAARYRLQTRDLGSLRPILSIAWIPQDLSGSLEVEGRVQGPLAAPTWTAVVSAHGLRLGGQEIRVASGGLRAAEGRIRLEELRLLADGGALTAHGSFPIAAEAGDWQVQADLERFPLNAAPLRIPLRGAAQGQIRLTGPAEDPDLAGSLKLALGEGEASLEFGKEGALLRLDSLKATWGGGTLEASGRYDLTSHGITSRFRGRDLQVKDLPGSLSGRLSFSGELEGSAQSPEGKARVRLEDVSLQGSPLPSLTAEILSDGSKVQIEAILPDRHLLSATCPLEAPYPVRATVDLSAVPTDALLASFPKLAEAAPALEMAGRVEITFPAFDPRALRYLARVEKLLGRYRDMGGGAGAPFEVEGDLESLRLTDLELVGTQTAIAVAGTVPLATQGSFDLNLRGALRLELARTLFPELDVDGEANIDLTLTGSRTAPKIVGEAKVEQAGLAWRRVHIDEIAAELDSNESNLSLKSMRGTAMGGIVELEGVLPWPRPRPGRPARASFRLSEVDLTALLPPATAEEATPRPSIRANVSGTLEADSLELEAVSGSGSIEEVRARWGEAFLASTGPARFRLERGRIELPRAELKGGESEIQLGVKAELPGERFGWEASLRGVLDSALLNPLIAPADIVLSGRTRLDVAQKSSPDGPLYSGSGVLEGARLVLREPPLTLSEIRGRIHFQDRALLLSNLTAELGGGRVTGSGRIDLAGFAGLERVDLEAEAQAVRLNYPEGLRSESSGSFRLRGTPERFVLSGEVRLAQGLYDRNISLQAEILKSARREALPLTQQDSFQDRVELELRARTENDLRIDNNLVSAETAAVLRVSGSLAAPQVSGVLSARPGGTFRLGRNGYRIESGQMDLDDYPLAPPEIALRARTVVSNVDIVVDVRGTAEDLRTELSAPGHPELTRADLASLLVTGRTLERGTTQDSQALGELTGSEILGEQLVNLFSGALADLATSGLGQALPFDQVSIEPTLIAREADPGARFTLGKALTPELFVTYSVGLNEAEKQIWIVDYRLPRNLQVRAVREDDNTLTGGFSQRMPIDLYPRSRRLSLDGVAPPRLASVEIATDRPELALEVKLSAGDRYDYWKAQEDAERLRKALRKLGFPGAVVDIDSREVGERGVALTFRVRAGDRLQILWQGDDPGRAVRRKIASAWEGRIPENLLLSELAAAATRELKRRRYYTARVNVTTTEGPGERRVIFHVARGPRGSRVRMEFQGHQSLSDEELSSVLPEPSSALFFELVEARPFRLRELLRSQYASRGFLDARVDLPETVYDPTSGEIRVAIPIEEGPPARVGDIAFEGLSALTESEALEQMRLRQGGLFLLADYLRDRAALRALYRRRGFADARVRSRIERPKEAVRVVFQVEEGERALVGPVRIEGNLITRESLIRRQLTFRSGEPLQADALTASQRQLYDLGAFRSAEVRAEPQEPGAREREVVVEVSESPDLDFNYGIRYNTEERFEALAEARFPNLFGRALHFGLTGLVNPDQSIIRASLHTPYFSRYKLDTDVYAARESKEDENAISRITRFTFQQSRELARRLRLQWGYSFRRSYTLGKVESSPFPFEFRDDRASLNVSLIQDRRDNVISPRRGRFWSLSFEYAPEPLGSDIQFEKFYGQLFYYRSLRKDWIWASGYRIGLAEGLGRLPLGEDRFQAGGSTTVRGFARNSLGPAPQIGGEAVLIFNQEIRFPIYRWFSGAGFYDAGNVFTTVGDFHLSELRHSLGLGVRFGFSFGLLRLDWARVLDPRPGDEASRYFFSIGHAF